MLVGGGGVPAALDHLRLPADDDLVAAAVTRAAIEMDSERKKAELEAFGNVVASAIARAFGGK